MRLDQNVQNADFEVISVSNDHVAKYTAKVFGWMFLGLLVSGITALLIAFNPQVAAAIWGVKYLPFGILIGQIFLVGYMAVRLEKMNYGTLVATFLAYAVLTGITMSIMFFAYSMASILKVFGITALTFGAMSVLGYTTKTDLTQFGKIMMMGLIGVVIASIVNIFTGSSTLEWIISFVGLGVFIGLTAYDAQKIKSYALIPDAEMRRKASIFGALSLYLDFINMFYFLLRLFGNRN